MCLSTVLELLLLLRHNFNKKTPHALEDFTKVLMVNSVGTFNVICLSVGLVSESEPNEDGERGVIINPYPANVENMVSF